MYLSRCKINDTERTYLRIAIGYEKQDAEEIAIEIISALSSPEFTLHKF
jgi:hypothetical protein